jgi:hypothetical protein
MIPIDHEENRHRHPEQVIFEEIPDIGVYVAQEMTMQADDHQGQKYFQRIEDGIALHPDRRPHRCGLPAVVAVETGYIIRTMAGHPLLLQQFPLLKPLPTNELEQLAGQARTKNFAKSDAGAHFNEPRTDRGPRAGEDGRPALFDDQARGFR